MVVDTSPTDDVAPAAGTQAAAFDALMPTSPDYARLPILDGFSWTEQLSSIDSGRWYLVVFRSVCRPDADMALLIAADDLAFEDALRQPGFLHYFKGTPNARGECLSFCLWTDQAAAQHAGRQPAHQAAMQLVADMYVSYVLERYRIGKAYGGRVWVKRLNPHAAAHHQVPRFGTHQGRSSGN